MRKHQNKHIRACVDWAEKQGWAITEGKGHAFCILLCPWNSKECRCGEFCRISVWSTPRNPEAHAASLKRLIEKCINLQKVKEDG